MLNACGLVCFAISCRSPQSVRIKYNLLNNRCIAFLNFAINFFLNHILQIYSDLYFILPDPTNLQEIAKRTDNQHFRYTQPNYAQKVLRTSSCSATLRKIVVLRTSSSSAALRKIVVLRTSSCSASLRKILVLRTLMIGGFIEVGGDFV